MSMFEDQNLPDLKPKTEVSAPFVWSSLPIELLLQYRDEIDRHLPPLTLKEMNLEKEMLLQYHGLRALQNQVLNDDDIPLNQRAQVANAVAGNLSKLADLQETLYSSERFKMVENLLIKTLNSLPDEAAQAFLADYHLKIDKISGN